MIPICTIVVVVVSAAVAPLRSLCTGLSTVLLLFPDTTLSMHCWLHKPISCLLFFFLMSLFTNRCWCTPFFFQFLFSLFFLLFAFRLLHPYIQLLVLHYPFLRYHRSSSYPSAWFNAKWVFAWLDLPSSATFQTRSSHHFPPPFFSPHLHFLSFPSLYSPIQSFSRSNCFMPHTPHTAIRPSPLTSYTTSHLFHSYITQSPCSSLPFPSSTTISTTIISFSVSLLLLYLVSWLFTRRRPSPVAE